MKRMVIWVVGIGSILAACNGSMDRNEPLDKDRMVKVLIDIHLAEASYSNRGNPSGQVDRLLAGDYQAIFDRHGITPDEFQFSFHYYLDRPEVMREIYAELVNQLTEKEGRFRQHRVPLPADTVQPAPVLPTEP